MCFLICAPTFDFMIICVAKVILYRDTKYTKVMILANGMPGI